MSTHRRHRHATPLTGSALMLAAALALTACQQADPGEPGGESENTSNATVSPSGSGDGPSSGSGSDGGSEGSDEGEASESGPGDAEISASAVPDHLLPPDNDETQAMVKAVEKTMGRPVANVDSGTVNDHRHQGEKALEMMENPDFFPMESEECRAVETERAEAYAAATAQETRLAGEQPDMGDDREVVIAPFLVEVVTFEDAAGAQEYLQALLKVSDTQECAGEPSAGMGSTEYQEHEWGEGVRYTFEDDGGQPGGGVYAATVAGDGNHLFVIRDSVEPGGDVAAALERQTKAVDALAEVKGAPRRD